MTSGGKPLPSSELLSRPERTRSNRSERSSRSRWRSLPICVVLAQHARPHGILNALDRGFSRKAAFDSLAKATVPSLVVGKHAIGFEHVAMLAGRRQMLVLEHLVDVRL